MKIWKTLIGSAAVLALSVASVQAGPLCDGHKSKAASDETTQVAKTGCAAKAKAQCSAKKTCRSSEFPTMVRMIGDEVVSCPMALKKAEESGTKVVFTVAGERYDSEPAAMHALAEASEKYMERFLSIGCLVDGEVKYCDEKAKDGKTCSAKKATCAKAAAEKTGKCNKDRGEVQKASAEETCKKAKSEGCKKAKSGCCSKSGKPVKFVVAGQVFDTREDAEKARDAVLAVVEKVSMKYVVNGKEVDSCSKVCPTAKKAGQVEFVVGTEKIKCEDKARFELSRAKYQAAKEVNGKSVASL